MEIDSDIEGDINELENVELWKKTEYSRCVDSDLEKDIIELNTVELWKNRDSVDHNERSNKNVYLKALALNENAETLLIELQRKLMQRLSLCREKLSNIKKVIHVRKQSSEKPDRRVYTYYCGIPFFKHGLLNYFTHPPNVDSANIKNIGISRHFDDNRFAIKWTQSKKKYLESEILNYLRRKNTRDLNVKIKRIKNDLKVIDNDTKNRQKKKTLLKILQANEETLMKINTLPLSKLAQSLDDKDDIDWEYLAMQSGVEHKAVECRSLWRVFLHPSISKKGWAASEQRALRSAALARAHQDWEAVARDLGTQRTAYQCFVFYKSRLARIDSSQWTPREEQYLRFVIDKCRIGSSIPWNKVSYYIQNRSKEQIYNHYVYQMTSSRKGRFTYEEDSVLLAAAREFGCNFAKIAEYLPTRNMSQVRTRYGILNSKQNTPYNLWTLKEDVLLLDLVKKERQNSDTIKFNLLTQYFENKSLVSLRTRLRTLENWLSYNPRKSIESAPRRKNFTSRSEDSITLKEALLQLANSNTVSPKKIVNISRFKNHVIHKNILNFYKDKLKQENAAKLKNSTLLPLDASELRNILLFMGAKLNKQLVEHESPKFASLDFKEAIDKLLISEHVNSSVSIKTRVIKTYSRKRDSETIATLDKNNDTLPSYWFDPTKENQFSVQPYLFPPFYNNTEALKILMLNKTNASTSQYSAQLEAHSGLSLWRSRFERIFSWPAILSNIKPNISVNLFNESKILSIASRETVQNDLHDTNFFTTTDDKPYIAANGRANRRKLLTHSDPILDKTDPKINNPKVKKRKLKKILSSDITILENSAVTTISSNVDNGQNLKRLRKRKRVEY